MSGSRKPATGSSRSSPAILDRARLDQARAATPAVAVLPVEMVLIEESKQQLLREFMSVLQEDPAIDRETRELLQQHFSQALNDAESASEPATEIPDSAMWMDAVRMLQAEGAVAENEADELIRQLSQAIQPLQQRESRLAIEFSRRIQDEGHEKALAWFRREASSTSDETKLSASSSQLPPLGDTKPSLRTEVVNSRSRRLRGPPG